MGTVSLAGLAGLPALAVAASADGAAPQGQGAAAEASSGVTRALARYVVSARYADLPAPVRKEAQRSFLNWIGCAVGGSRHETVDVRARRAGAVLRAARRPPCSAAASGSTSCTPR